ncbi:hypothetical protein K438DRAFT_1937301 [Mycena galopus ATCC 62051]|nr:hypothetical protein K438DRAFT_1937301 [Mycena galopus ATCC 62051]
MSRFTAFARRRRWRWGWARGATAGRVSPARASPQCASAKGGEAIEEIWRKVAKIHDGVRLFLASSNCISLARRRLWPRYVASPLLLLFVSLTLSLSLPTLSLIQFVSPSFHLCDHHHRSRNSGPTSKRGKPVKSYTTKAKEATDASSSRSTAKPKSEQNSDAAKEEEEEQKGDAVGSSHD